ncbi:hypothetical protein GLOTRDRAFT_138570 [Gloeophyllum trabeum ATCC 11539]|uniref:Rap-GAP domain-containing protein n=1 Tax=Gloeophyllum trabeum (strain ATCC 11539 / FP-39264 / Madison 617) TaxID=670483 RepID=S7Q8M8_GLOTA|nr:uncharacterized protein GLOTRDRAFT_138570 [Gloeophyllum trabeum ATCC 11539]EPQ55778.1 hypothetical protein GLOTRDRAFT_138570 [Gloeophyllum trabeum ATCC 11539]
MAPPAQDAESSTRPTARARSNTTSLFSWRNKARPDAPAPAAPLPSVDELVQALAPPAVPSLHHARQLVHALSASSIPPPGPASFNPILAGLCDPTAPVPLQAVGFDLLASYLASFSAVNGVESAAFTMLLSASPVWNAEVWEPRLRALSALAQVDSDVPGRELAYMGLATSWIESAFEGLLAPEKLGSGEKAERERAIEKVSDFVDAMNDKLKRLFTARENELAGLLGRYADLVERALSSSSRASESTTSPFPDQPGSSNTTTPTKSPPAHRRHPSSTSIPLLSPSSLSSTPPPKLPIDVALLMYLKHLSFQLAVLTPIHLETILPLLFRCLAHYAHPLPRLSLDANHPHPAPPVEKRLRKTLYQLFTGPFASSCTLVLRRHLRPPDSPVPHTQTSLGAFRAARNMLRTALLSRLAKAKFTGSYTPSGAPAHIDAGPDVMKYACLKEDLSAWETARVCRALHAPVKAWIALEADREAKEAVLEEAVGVVKDILQEVDERPEDDEGDVEEAGALGQVLYQLALYADTLRTQDGLPLPLPLKHPTTAATPFTRSLASVLARESDDTPTDPSLPMILLVVADHITDEDTAKLVRSLDHQHELSPISPDWLANWSNILTHAALHAPERPLTRARVLRALENAYATVKDMAPYRKPFSDLILEFWRSRVFDHGEQEEGDIVWHILGEEVVLRTAEAQVDEATNEPALDPADHDAVDAIIDFLATVASGSSGREDDSVYVPSVQTLSPTSQSPVPQGSPVLSRVQSEYAIQSREKESSMPSVISILSSFSAGKSQTHLPESPHESQFDTKIALPSEAQKIINSVGAVMGLISIFTQLAFTPRSLLQHDLALAVRMFHTLVHLLRTASCPRARLTILQFMMRLRADRDHRLFYVEEAYDRHGHIRYLASLIGRAAPNGTKEGERLQSEEPAPEVRELRKPRPSVPQERNGRLPSRGRAVHKSASASSRSRSRANPRVPITITSAKPPRILWVAPEVPTFSVVQVDTPSEGLISYDPNGPGLRIVLPISSYLSALVDIILEERDWEVLSYVLCHLPNQLANKHLFCGPKTRKEIMELLRALCSGISSGNLAHNIESWPPSLKPRDAQGLAYHTLSVLLSYRRYLEPQLHHALVEVFLAGLSGQQSTIKCCLHALTLSAFELQPSMTRYLSKILEKLAQIMSNPVMAVHILNFLSMVAAVPALYANFTESDFKMVFGVALQYLQHHNRPGGAPTMSWALSQHVRIICYYVVYIWFLAVKLPDRPRHVRFITRQLLLANEGRTEVDEPTEVCFDWLARYTYASADPRPASSLLNDLVMNPRLHQPEAAVSEKTWIVGNSVVTIRALARLGWLEVVSRRPSGSTKFLCRTENVPMVGPGDVDPDFVSIPASLMMDRSPRGDASGKSDVPEELQDIFATDRESDTSRPDPITGYVWSGTAPSQRRKDVAVDPSFFALQLSPYPDTHARGRLVTDHSMLPAFFRTLDRMPVIDTHKVGIMYVAPGQTQEEEILRNNHGSPAYTRFLEGIGRLINLRGQVDVYAGGLEPDEDGEYAYAWWDDIGQILYHTATLMPTDPEDKYSTNKKRHIGNDYVRIVWNDSGVPYRFDTLRTEFQFVNIVIEPHSQGTIAAFSDNRHEHEYFKVTVQHAPGMTEFTPIGDFKLISAENLPLLVRQLSLLADWFAAVFQHTQNDTIQVEVTTNWRSRLQAIRRFQASVPAPDTSESPVEGIMAQEIFRDFSSTY